MTTRRKMLALTGAFGFSAVTHNMVNAKTVIRRPTASQTLGPFYPETKPADSDADLTRVAGRGGRAQGQVIQVQGRVINPWGEAFAGVAVEIWQANSFGRYDHPGDGNDAPLDPNFQGFARVVTDAQGQYRFTTIKPSGYPAGGSMRPPHIHFKVTGKQDRLVTQMYFAGEPLNARDRQLAQFDDPAKVGLIATLERPATGAEPGLLLANWDIVLRNG